MLLLSVCVTNDTKLPVHSTCWLLLCITLGPTLRAQAIKLYPTYIILLTSYYILMEQNAERFLFVHSMIFLHSVMWAISDVVEFCTFDEFMVDD